MIGQLFSRVFFHHTQQPRNVSSVQFVSDCTVHLLGLQRLVLSQPIRRNSTDLKAPVLHLELMLPPHALAAQCVLEERGGTAITSTSLFHASSPMGGMKGEGAVLVDNLVARMFQENSSSGGPPLLLDLPQVLTSSPDAQRTSVG